MAYKCRRSVLTCKTPWSSLRQLDETRWRIKKFYNYMYCSQSADHYFSFKKLFKKRSKIVFILYKIIKTSFKNNFIKIYVGLPTTFNPKLPFIFQQAEVVGRKSEQNQEGWWRWKGPEKRRKNRNFSSPGELVVLNNWLPNDKYNLISIVNNTCRSLLLWSSV